MTHILTYGPKMVHGHEENEAVAAMARNLEKDKEIESERHPTAGRRNSLTDKAKGIFHEVAGMTRELAQEVKDKITGHVTEKDIAIASQKVADLKTELANEQYQVKEIQLAAELAEDALNLREYEALKAKEVQTKCDVREIEREIAEAEGDYIRLQYARLMQKHAQKNKTRAETDF